MDLVEAEYERAIRFALQRGDNDEALEYATGLHQYQTLYKQPQKAACTCPGCPGAVRE